MSRTVLVKEVIGDPVVIGGRELSLSRAIRAGDFIFLTGQLPFIDGKPMTHGTIEEQTTVVIESIRDTLSLAGCTLDNVVKSMVWLTRREDFAGFDSVYSHFFVDAPPARSAVVSDLLLDVRLELEVVAFDPASGSGVGSDNPS